MALGKLPNSWRCGIGRFASEHLRMGLQSVDKPSNQLVEGDGAVLGFAWTAATRPDALRIHVIAAAGPVFLALLDWACGSCRQPTVLRTSALVGGQPSAALTARGFTAYSTQRWMQLRAGASPVPELPGPYRFAEFEERQLGSLLALRPCAARIELLVMDRNPAERIYERMGFEVVEDTVNLGGRFGLR